MVKLFVGGYPSTFTELEIVQLVSPYATVVTIKIVRDKISKKSKGYAFLEIADIAGADNAMDALDGLKMDGRVLKVNKVAELTGELLSHDKPKRPRQLPR